MKWILNEWRKYKQERQFKRICRRLDGLLITLNGEIAETEGRVNALEQMHPSSSL